MSPATEVYVGRTARGEHVYASIRIEPADVECTVTFTDHSTGPRPAEVAISWTLLSNRAPVLNGRRHPADVPDGYWLSTGQMDAQSRRITSNGERYARGAAPMPRADRDALAAAWERWHLNLMRAWCEHMGPEAGIGDVCPEIGYRYGSAWLAEAVPVDVLANLERIANVYRIARIDHDGPEADDEMDA